MDSKSTSSPEAPAAQSPANDQAQEQASAQSSQEPSTGAAASDPTKPLTKRELITDLISRLHPDSDLSDEETLFGHIFDDYSQYAQVLDDRDHELALAHAQGELYGRNAKIEELLSAADPPSDGVPSLSGTSSPSPNPSFTSIFDIARGIS